MNSPAGAPSESRISILVNGEHRDVAPGLTVAALLETLSVRPTQIAVELNREILPRGRFAVTELGPGDQLEIVTFVGGG